MDASAPGEVIAVNTAANHIGKREILLPEH